MIIFYILPPIHVYTSLLSFFSDSILNKRCFASTFVICNLVDIYKADYNYHSHELIVLRAYVVRDFRYNLMILYSKPMGCGYRSDLMNSGRKRGSNICRAAEHSFLR